MQFVPWRSVADWRCIGCGDCCRLYSVVINFNEWLGIVKYYGVEKTVPGLSKFFIKRNGDGSCAFLCNFAGSYRCALQNTKPKACQMWPFKVLDVPKYGNANEAAYQFGGNTVFIYADSNCNGMRYGNPALGFAYQTLREFVEIAMDFHNKQFRSTGAMDFSRSQLHFDRLRLSNHV